MLSCREATELMSKSLDEPLTWSDRLHLRVHLLLCTYCRRFLRQTRWLHGASHDNADDGHRYQSGPALTPAARERIIKAMDQERSAE